jgi:hypothetical protein
MASEAQRFVSRIHEDSMRVGRYRWTITEDFQIHLYSPQSYATRREAREDANKVIRDLNQWANQAVDICARELSDCEPMPEEQGKDPHDVARRKLGGRRGGKAPATAMTLELKLVHNSAAELSIFGRTVPAPDAVRRGASQRVAGGTTIRRLQHT